MGYRNLGDVYVQLARHAYARGRELEPAAGEPAVRPLDTSGTQPYLDVSAASIGTGVTFAQMGRAAAGAAGDPHAACMVAGKFTDPRAVDDAQLLLRSHGGEIVDVRVERRRVSSGYRVYMPPLASRQRAEQRLRALRGEGIRDVSVILDGPLRNAISLGFYRDKRNVDRRVNRLERLGYSVRLEDNSTRLEEYTVIEARVNGTRDTLRAAWASRFPEHPIQRVDCA